MAPSIERGISQRNIRYDVNMQDSPFVRQRDTEPRSRPPINVANVGSMTFRLDRRERTAASSTASGCAKVLSIPIQ